MKKLLIFDSFGVLAKEITPNFFLKRFSLEEANVRKNFYFEPADRGELSYFDALRNIAKDFSLSYEDVLKEMNSYILINSELFTWIKNHKNKEGYTFALLSNCSEGLMPLVYKKISLEQYFDVITLSFEEKMSKPDIRIYKRTLEKAQKYAPFDEIFMIDDNPKNLVPAKNLGFKTILFSNNESFFSLLQTN